jgi:hypothetical protein
MPEHQHSGDQREHDLGRHQCPVGACTWLADRLEHSFDHGGIRHEDEHEKDADPDPARPVEEPALVPARAQHRQSRDGHVMRKRSAGREPEAAPGCVSLRRG